MNKVFSLFLSVLLAMTTGVTAASSAGENVTVQVFTFDGQLIDDDFTSVTSTFQRTPVAVAKGEARLSLPDGKHSLSIRTVPGSNGGNTVVSTVTFDVMVSGDTRAIVRLPRVKQISIALSDALLKDGHIQFGIGGFDSRDRQNERMTGSLGQFQASVTVGGSTSVVAGFSGSLTPLFIPSSVMLGGIINGRGPRVENGRVSFQVFDPIPLAKMDPYYTLRPDISRQFDFDGDGFRDYTYSFAFGETGYKTGSISHAKLFSEAASVALEGGVRIEVGDYSQFMSKPNTTFRVTGRVVAPSAAFLNVNSKITAHTVTSFSNFVYSTRIGESQVKSDGSFEVVVTLTEPARINAIVPKFYLSTTTGTTTLDFPFPELLSPQASIKWSGSQLQIAYSGMPSSGSQLLAEASGGKRGNTLLEGESGVAFVTGLPVSNRILLRSDFYEKQFVIPTKFSNCAQLWKSFDGGVSRSSSSGNKGGKILKKPTVFAAGYAANKALDRDKDGLACER